MFNNSRFFICWIACVTVCTMRYDVVLGQTPASVDYATQVHPVLTKYCFGCHTGAEPDGGVRLDQASALFDPLESSAVPIVPGKPESSLLLQLIVGTAEPKMPPVDEPAPTADDIAVLKQWIEQGAKYPASLPPIAPATPRIELTAPARVPIYASAWHPNGKRFAIGKPNRVELWGPQEQAPQWSFDQCRGAVNQVRFSPDGRYLYAASGQPGLFGEVVCLNSQTGQPQWTVTGHADAIYSLAVQPSGKMLATGSYDRTILLWDAETGQQIAQLNGHHGGVNGLDFHPDGRWLASAADDKTVKLWDVVEKKRIATLSEPTMAQAAVRFHPRGNLLAAAGQDKRIRVWQIDRTDAAGDPKILYTRFAHDAPILALTFSPDGKLLFTAAEDQVTKAWEADSFTQLKIIDRQIDWVTALAATTQPPRLLTTRLDGGWDVSPISVTGNQVQLAEAFELLATPPVGPPSSSEPVQVQENEPNGRPETAQFISVPAVVNGVLDDSGSSDADLFRFTADPSTSLVIETKAERMKSPADTKLEILTADGQPVLWLKLRSVRDSYIKFRPIDSRINGIRMHNWEEVRLNDYLYMAGEVVRIFQLPRGPDADFRFYLQGKARRAYFGTSGLAHALEDPLYIVEPYPANAQFVENGLPVFPIYFENDDEESQRLGSDSRVLFIPPTAGEYLVRVTDVRQFHGPNFNYELTVRQARPDFAVTLKQPQLKVARGSGSNLTVNVDRLDGFEGDVEVAFTNLPDGVDIASPLLIPAGHFFGDTVVNVGADASITDEQIEQIQITASARVVEKPVTHTVAGFKKLELLDPPKLTLRFLPEPSDQSPEPNAAAQSDQDQPTSITIAPGQTIRALLQLERNGFDGEIKLDVNNLPHGIIVDNIGLSGVLVRAGEENRPIFLTAADWVTPQDRLVHAVTLGQGNQASSPILLKVRRSDGDIAER